MAMSQAIDRRQLCMRGDTNVPTAIVGTIGVIEVLTMMSMNETDTVADLYPSTNGVQLPARADCLSTTRSTKGGGPENKRR
jgi:hypothetical protein